MRVLVILCCSVCLALALTAKPIKGDDAKLTKQVQRGFKVKSDVSIDLSNKYGQITVNSWEKDSVAVTVVVTVYGKTDFEAQRQLDRIDIGFRHSSNFLTVETKFEAGNAVTKDLWNSVSDASRAITNKSKVVVDYEVWLPSAAALAISNKFGDVYIGGHNGRFRLDLSHGDLMAGQFEGYTDLSIGFGKAKVQSLTTGKLSLKGASLDLLKSSKLDINSSSSDISIGILGSLFIDSRNDKVYIENVSEVSGKGYFTDMRIQKLATQLDASMFYGGISIAQSEVQFKRIKIISKNTTVSLNLDLASTFDYLISGREEKIFLPSEMKDLKKEVDRMVERNVLLTGTYGYAKVKGIVDINADNGEVIVTMQPPVPFSTNKKR